MMEVQIEISEQTIEEIRKRLGGLQNKTPTVLSRAINRTTTNIKKNMAQQTAGKDGKYNIKSEDVKESLNVQKATTRNLQGRVAASGHPLLLTKFNADKSAGPIEPVTYENGKPNPRFYSAKVKKRGGKKALTGNPRAFIGTSKAGLIFLQRFSGKRYPLEPLYGPSVPQMIENEKTIEFIYREAESTLQKRIDAEINNILRKG